MKTKRNLSDDTNVQNQNADNIWIARRKNMPLCARRIAMDLRDLADEIEQLAATQQRKDAQMREILGVPRGVSFLN